MKILLTLAFLLASLPVWGQYTIGSRSFYAPSTSGPISYVTGNAEHTGVSATTVSVALSGGSPGDLIICNTAWSLGTSGLTPTVSDGTTNLTALTQVNDGSYGNYGQSFYLLSANGGSKTYTATFTSTESYIELACLDFHTLTGTWHYDASAVASDGGTESTALSVGPITTTGANEVAFLSSKLSQVAATISNMLIGGAAPVQPLASQSYPGYGYRIYTSTPGSVSGSLTYSVATQWVSGLSAFYAQ